MLLFSHSLLSEVRKARLNSHVVCDAGRTQIAPGSQTVLCIGPGVCCCVVWTYIRIIMLGLYGYSNKSKIWMQNYN